MTAVTRWRVAWRRGRRVAMHELVPRALRRDGVVLAQHVREGRFQRSLSGIAAFSALLSGIEVTYQHSAEAAATG